MTRTELINEIIKTEANWDGMSDDELRRRCEGQCTQELRSFLKLSRECAEQRKQLTSSRKSRKTMPAWPEQRNPVR